MENLIDRIKRINSKYISLYTNLDKILVMRNVNKIPGVIDSEYYEFLKETNGASILDYCFFGLKNNKLGSNVYNAITDLWLCDNLLTLRFWGVAATSTGEYFGYLNKENDSGSHFIGFYESNEPGKVYLVASSFSIFLGKFLTQIEFAISQNANALGLNNNDWFLDLNSLVKNDPEMHKYILEKRGNAEYLSTIYE